MVLAGKIDELTSHIVTCTLASYVYKSHYTHLLLLVEGYVPSIPHFMDTIEGFTLKVSTTHSHNPKIRELFIDKLHQNPTFAPHIVITEPELLQNPKLRDRVLTHYTGEDSSTAKAEKCYKRNNLQLRLHGEEDPSITCEVLAGECLLSTNGSFAVQETWDDEYESMISELHNLDEPHDTLDVTAVSMVVKQDNGTVIALNMFLAGHLEKGVSEQGDTWTISTVRLKNNDLHRMIAEECEATINEMQTAGAPERMEYWKNESLLFTVTDIVPGYDCDGIENLQALSPSNYQHPLQNSESSRRQYLFCHPENENVRIRVYEPYSPGMSEMEPGVKSNSNKKVTVTLQQSKKKEETVVGTDDMSATHSQNSDQFERNNNRGACAYNVSDESNRRNVGMRGLKRSHEQSDDGYMSANTCKRMKKDQEIGRKSQPDSKSVGLI